MSWTWLQFTGKLSTAIINIITIITSIHVDMERIVNLARLSMKTKVITKWNARKMIMQYMAMNLQSGAHKVRANQ